MWLSQLYLLSSQHFKNKRENDIFYCHGTPNAPNNSVNLTKEISEDRYIKANRSIFRSPCRGLTTHLESGNSKATVSCQTGRPALPYHKYMEPPWVQQP